MRQQEKTMFEAGYLPAAEVARILQFAHVGSVHRAADRGKLRAQRLGIHWFISAHSVLHFYGEDSPILRASVVNALDALKVPIIEEKPRRKLKPGRVRIQKGEA